MTKGNDQDNLFIMLMVTGEADRLMATVERQAHAFMPWQMVLRSLLILIIILTVTKYHGGRRDLGAVKLLM